MHGSLLIKRVVICLAVIAALSVAALSVAATLVPAIESRSELDGISTLEDRLIYRVERDGQIVGFFTEVSGLGSENEIVEYRDGGENDAPRKLPGGLRYCDITLERPISRDLTAWQWRQEVVNGESPLSAVTITMLRRTGAPVARWDLFNVWPSKIKGPSTSGDDDGLAIEEITLAVERIERVQ